MGQIDMQPRAPLCSPSALSGVTLSPPRILRSSLFAGLLVLLLLGCGGHAAVTGANSSSPSVGFTSTPPVEGSGPESAQSVGNGGGGGGGGGGVSISLAGLPIGNTSPVTQNSSGSAECVEASWSGTQQMPSEVTVTVTNVVAAAPFTVTDLAAGGCGATSEPECKNSQFSATEQDNGPACLVGVEWTGEGQPQDASGSLEFFGDLNCENTDSAACQKIGDDIVYNSGQSQMIHFDFCAPDQCIVTTPSTSLTSPTGPGSVSTTPAPPVSPSSASTSPASPDTSSP